MIIGNEHLYDRDMKEVADKLGDQTKKVFFIECKEITSRTKIVIGASSQKEAVQLVEEHFECYDEEIDGKMINIWQSEQEMEYHGDLKPKVRSSMKVKKCMYFGRTFGNWWNRCGNAVTSNENVCGECLEHINQGDALHPLESE